MRIRTRVAVWLASSGMVLTTGLAALNVVLSVRGAVVPLFDSVLAGTIWSLSCLTFAVVGALVVRRHPRLVTGWICLGIGVLLAAQNLIANSALHALRMGQVVNPLLPLLGRTLWMPPIMLMSIWLPLTFPDGRLPSSRWRLVAWTALAVLVLKPLLQFMQPGSLGAPFAAVTNPFGLPPPAGEVVMIVSDGLTLVWLGTALAAVAGLVVRFRHADVIARLQLKWLVFAVALQTVLLLVGVIPAVLGLAGAQAVAAVVFPAWPALLPVAVGVAILRYRLWDIDLIIRRTLVYTLLTLTLGLVYFGCIVVSRTLVAPLTGGSQLAIVASTLAIAALFNPVRRRIQTLIDRRFYRRKYDAEKVLARFGATMRTETELERLTTALLRVVEETMQPRQVSVWLGQPLTASRQRNDEREDAETA